MDYLTHWANIYAMHFGAWVSLAIVATLHKNGVPIPRKIPPIVLSSVLLALVGALFSSHSHTHYLESLIK